MSRKRVYKVERHMPLEELKAWIKGKEKEIRVLKRLYFIRYLYDGDSVENASKKIGVVKAVGYEWLRRWNKRGYEGLIPNFGGGRPSKLTESQKDDLVEMLKKKDNWTLPEVRLLIKEKFGVEYSENQVRRILKSFGMKHAKPYPHDYRRPDNAEELLKKT